MPWHVSGIKLTAGTKEPVETEGQSPGKGPRVQGSAGQGTQTWLNPRNRPWTSLSECGAHKDKGEGEHQMQSSIHLSKAKSWSQFSFNGTALVVIRKEDKRAQRFDNSQSPHSYIYNSFEIKWNKVHHNSIKSNVEIIWTSRFVDTAGQIHSIYPIQTII